jgi:hypothetical protein
MWKLLGKGEGTWGRRRETGGEERVIEKADMIKA